MLKPSFPTLFTEGDYLGQVAYDREQLANNGEEVVAHKWSAVLSKGENRAFTCLNEGVHGSDCYGGELRLSFQLSVFKQAESSEDIYIIRLFELTGQPRITLITIPVRYSHRQFSPG